MEMNLDMYRLVAVSQGLPLQFVVKEYRAMDVLKQIAMAVARPNLKNFVFKGGTALNKVYLGQIQRFSEDLDFDLDVETFPKVKEFSLNLSKKLAGYSVAEFRRVGGTCQFSCIYDNPLGGRDFVRVDIAKKRIITDKPILRPPIPSAFLPGGVFATGLCVYSLEDLTARKINALAFRGEGKDFFDVYNALPLCGRMRGPIEKMLKSENNGSSADHFLEKAVRAVKRANPSKLKNLTNPFVPAPSRPKDWGQLRDDLAMRLENIL